MQRVAQLLGREADVDTVGRALYADAAGFQASIVGGVLVTCSDESERQVRDAFQRNFAEHLLPSLKLGERSFFRLANLGGRYETGAVGIAQQHYAADDPGKGFGLLVVKINSHVSAERQSGRYRFGRMKRYDTDSVYCGALHAMLDGSDLPFARQLSTTFRSGGVDRLKLLGDETRVAPEHRSLFVAVTNASLQAGLAVADIEANRPTQPTLFVVVHGVVLNKKQKDADIVCGIHHVDWRTDEPTRTYHGLGDDPSLYRVPSASAPLTIEDDTLVSGPTTTGPG